MSGAREGGLATAFGLDDDQAALRAAVRAAVARHSPMSVVRTAMDAPTASDPAFWAVLADVGLPGALVPEQCGGAGLGVVDVVVALEETGAALLCAPHLSTLAASAALAGAPHRERWAEPLGAIAGGGLQATLAVAEGGQWRPDRLTTVAGADADGAWRLSGHKELVLDGATAGLLLVSADTADGPGLFAVRGDDPGVTAVPVPALDQTRKLADVTLTGAPALRVGGADDLERALDVTVVLLGAEQLGAAQRILDRTLEHARTRTQYGRAIGSFQAVKHRLADVLIEVEYARAVVHHTAWAATSGPAELPAGVGVLRSTVSPALVQAAATAVQVHGGTGFTWEHDSHLYYKRAVSDELLFGSTTAHLDRLAHLLGLHPVLGGGAG
ncbi:MAG TPA: acyl-CoA dehydrogenase family protein [Mycobacteriales bacterium]|nr:acyl-CoA dehydrogenase family protein [Mycobacteriales bacterium]